MICRSGTVRLALAALYPVFAGRADAQLNSPRVGAALAFLAMRLGAHIPLPGVDSSAWAASPFVHLGGLFQSQNVKVLSSYRWHPRNLDFAIKVEDAPDQLIEPFADR